MKTIASNIPFKLVNETYQCDLVLALFAEGNRAALMLIGHSLMGRMLFLTR